MVTLPPPPPKCKSRARPVPRCRPELQNPGRRLKREGRATSKKSVPVFTGTLGLGFGWFPEPLFTVSG